MNNIKNYIMKNPLRLMLVLASVVVFFTGMILIAAWQGWSANGYSLANPASVELGPDSDIEGWARFDKDSYFMGEEATFQLQVRYRDTAVEPNFETFQNYISFQPFEQREVSAIFSDIGAGIKEYKLEYKLQAMGSRLSGSYGFNPAVLYYKNRSSQDEDMHSLRIPLPQVHVGTYYPFDINGITLLGLKGVILEPLIQRQIIMLIAGTILIGLSLALLWVFGRRRRMHELSVPEQLWRKFNEFRNFPIDNRSYLLNCEKIFSGLLTGHIQVSPEKFWSSAQADYGDVSTIVPKVRAILLRIYKISDPSDADVEELTVLIEETLSSLVEEDRLRTEMEPGFMARIQKQPRVVAFSGLIAVISIFVLFLATQPLLWSSPDIVQYNRLIPDLNNGIVIDENPYDQLTALGETSSIESVKAAAMFNAGTIRVNQSFASNWLSQEEQRQQHEMVLSALFKRQSAETFLHDLSGRFFHTEDELVVNLTNGAEHLLRAELDLQEAVRAQPDNENIRRNLELATKRRWVLLRKLAQIRDYYEDKEANKEKDEIFSDAGLIDIINAKVPEEFEDEEARSDDRGYIIFERF